MKRTNLLLESIYQRAPLEVIDAVLHHDGLTMDVMKVDGLSTIELVNNRLEKSKSYFGFKQFLPYYKELAFKLDHYIQRQQHQVTFDPLMDPINLDS